jgi:hypothetical protein
MGGFAMFSGWSGREQRTNDYRFNVNGFCSSYYNRRSHNSEFISE